MTDDRQPVQRKTARIAAVACCGLLGIFAVLSCSAVRTKSATYDEPLNALAAWIHLHLGDFRINFEQPPLPQYWAAMPNSARPLQLNLQDPNWLWMPQNSFTGWDYAKDMLFRTPGNDGAAFINRSRLMMVVLGVALGAVICLWAWQLGGPLAATIAAILYCLDPNMLGHAALIKNDVPIALLGAGIFLTLWHVGRRVTFARVVLLGVLVAAALNTKFSALLFGPIIAVLLLVRVLHPIPWGIPGGTAGQPAARAVVAGAIVLAVMTCSFAGIWACYGFRFAPSDDSSIALNTEIIRSERAYSMYQIDHPAPKVEPFDPSVSTGAQVAALRREIAALNEAIRAGRVAASEGELIQRAAAIESEAGSLLSESAGTASTTTRPEGQSLTQRIHDVRISAIGLTYQLYYAIHRSTAGSSSDPLFTVVQFLLDHRVLPSPWLHGLLLVQARSMVRDGFLMGEIRTTGWWYYFPLAMLFKTPVATLLAVMLAMVLGCRLLLRQGVGWIDRGWSIACLAVPVAIYMAVSMASNLDIGVRHVLVVYSFIYVGIAVLIARGMDRWRRPVHVAVAGLGVLLVIETAAAWPDYVAYFNFAAGGSRGGIRLLGDSNLDWGQDLPALQRWQGQNPGRKLALAYFGMAMPESYGIQYDPLPPWPPPADLLRTHVLAVSATYLQGITDPRFNGYQNLTPAEVLGGTIYLYYDRPAGR